MLKNNAVRKDFKMLSETMEGYPLGYFDNAATTLKPQSVIQAITDYYEKYSVNIHRGDYEISYQVTDKVEKARINMADFINASSFEQIIYTSGATESLNLVAMGYGLTHLKKGDVILTTEAEHASNILPWFEVAKATGAIIRYFPMNEEGLITDIDGVLSSDVKVVTLAHVSNVLGHINPVEEIIEKAHHVGAIVVLDGAQSAPHLKIDVQALDVDFFAFSGHKMLGPTGIGVLYGKQQLLDELTPLLSGGGANARFNMLGEVVLKGSPAKFEAGTPHIAGILGLDAAIEYLKEVGMDDIHAYELELRDYAYEAMKEMDHLKIYNPSARTGIIAFNVKGIFSQDVCAYLSKYGFALRAGNHCAKVLHEVIKTNDTCRLSLYLYNTKDEIDRFLEVIKDITLEKTVELYI